MSAPTIVSLSPTNQETDVVLGRSITVTFDQAIDPTSISTATVILYGPGDTAILGPDQLLKNDPSSVSGREYIRGKFTFPTASSFVFDPEHPLRPNTKYTLLIAGAGALIVKDAVKNATGTALAKSVQASFTTGVIDQAAQPPQSPLPWEDPAVQPWQRPQIDPNSIGVDPYEPQGNDLSRQIVLTFPGPLDPDTFNLSDVLCRVEPISNDPLVQVPANLNYAVTIDGNKLIITVGNWPSPPPAILPLANAPQADSIFEDPNPFWIPR